jgi:hypothetical protein
VAVEVSRAELALVGVTTGKVLLGLLHFLECENEDVEVFAD